MLVPPWTVIDQFPVRLGTLAAHRILDRPARPDRRYRRRTVLPVELVERGSCKIATRPDRARRARAGR